MGMLDYTTTKINDLLDKVEGMPETVADGKTPSGDGAGNCFCTRRTRGDEGARLPVPPTSARGAYQHVPALLRQHACGCA